MKTVVLAAIAFAAGLLIAQTPKAVPRHEHALQFAESARKASPQSFTHFFAGGSFGSVFIATPKDEIRAHYHAEHDESVVVLKGGGKMRIGDVTRNVGPGDVVFLPKGTIHSFLPEVGDEVLVSCFAPVFDGKDRVFVER